MNILCFREIYETTSIGSPLRRFAVDQCAWTMPSGRFESSPGAFPHALLIDLAIVFSEAVPERPRQRRSDGIDVVEYFVAEDEP